MAINFRICLVVPIIIFSIKSLWAAEGKEFDCDAICIGVATSLVAGKVADDSLPWNFIRDSAGRPFYSCQSATWTTDESCGAQNCTHEIYRIDVSSKSASCYHVAQTWGTGIRSVSMSPSGNLLATSDCSHGGGCQLVVFDLKTHQRVALKSESIPSYKEPDDRRGISFTPTKWISENEVAYEYEQTDFEGSIVKSFKGTFVVPKNQWSDSPW